MCFFTAENVTSASGETFGSGCCFEKLHSNISAFYNTFPGSERLQQTEEAALISNTLNWQSAYCFKEFKNIKQVKKLKANSMH